MKDEIDRMELNKKRKCFLPRTLGGTRKRYTRSIEQNGRPNQPQNLNRIQVDDRQTYSLAPTLHNSRFKLPRFSEP